MANALATAALLLLLSQPVQGAAFVVTPSVHKKKFTCIGIDSRSKHTTLPQLYSSLDGDHNDSFPDIDLTNSIIDDRRNFIKSIISMGLVASSIPTAAIAEDTVSAAAAAAAAVTSPVQVVATGDAKKLFTEGRALEAQGNILAAQRLYIKVTKISPRFIYGWANLSNTLVAQGELNDADQTYTKAINLCEENLKEAEETFGIKRCDDLYLLLLNRGSVRLNNGMPKEALSDLQRANTLRARPDAIILQNLARAQELNSFYAQSDKSYTTAISMTANEVNPFWLRSSMVKYQLGDVNGAMDLMKRVENRFPEAPEVRAAYAVLLLAKGDEDAARKKFLEIPDRQRVKYADGEFLDKVVAWPSAMKEGLSTLTKAVGDSS
jgi:tetratricopeptide (TPR) repeat protein